MNRRNLLKGMGAIALYGGFPGVLAEFASSCKSKTKTLRADFFSDDEFQLLEQVTDIMLPKTTTPGALETQVPYFLDLVVKNCLSPDDQKLIKKGLQKLNGEARGKFSSLSKKEKKSLVDKIDVAAYKNDADKAWFMIIKKLSLIGYFTSQEGMTKALNYVKVPGNYEACIPYKQGEKAMAKTFLIYW
jgi:hypothetical protein